MRRFDVLLVSDFRLPGGTNRSTAQELAINAALGMRTGLLQANSRLSSRAIPWDQVIIDRVTPDVVVPALPHTEMSAGLAILRHPIAAASMPDISRSAKVNHAIVVANQPAFKADGSLEYDPDALTHTVAERIGVVPEWAPIGPVVRESLLRASREITLRKDDWTNVFATGERLPARRSFDRARPRIGRHSRPQAAKWPTSPAEILAAYPDSESFDVRILGGAEPAFETLGYQPANWTVHPFGALDPMTFLDEIDFWVYYHHPNWVEAYGRAIMEALRSGAVVVLPEYLRATYGDAAVYAEPSEVTALIESFSRGERDYAAQSLKGQDFANALGPDLHARRLRELLLPPSTTSDEPAAAPATVALKAPTAHLAVRRPTPRTRYSTAHRPRALFITSNGVGMGHLTRMLGVARECADFLDPVFFAMAQGISVVASAGLPYEYVPFSTALQTSSPDWHHYFRDRLLAAIDHYEAEIIAFDATWPYRGLLDALSARDVLAVWVRRGMWKPSITTHELRSAPRFDLVIEPGDYAASYDRGATSQVRDARLVAPVTVLHPSEMLPRQAARRALGLEESPDARYALVTLGAGNINDVGVTQQRVLSRLERHPEWRSVLTRPPIAAQQTGRPTHSLSTFPLARYTRAFDFAVSASGYNSFTECMAGGLPTLWIPNTATMTDDQDARARWAADQGYGLRCDEGDGPGTAHAIDLLCDDSVRSRLSKSLATLAPADGAAQAAALLREAWRSRLRGSGVLA